MAADRIRLTITVTPEVHAVFSRMADAAGISLGKCMGEWLGDTIEGAQFVAQKMEDARKAPRVVMREMQAVARGFVDEVEQLQAEMRQGHPGPAAQRPSQGGRAASIPPSSNTGGKPPSKTRRPAGGKL